MRVNLSWPGELIPGAKTPDRCPLHANSLQNLENPGCPADMFPSGVDSDDASGNTSYITPDSGGGISATVLILISASVILLIAIGGGLSLVLKKPKKKQKKRLSSQVNESQVVEPEPEEESLPEDDPNYKVDENGCEWWYDEGVWWYRTPEMDDWAEYDS